MTNTGGGQAGDGASGPEVVHSWELEDVRASARLVARAATSKGGTDTLILEVGAVIAITDVFVITSGANRRQVRTIAEEIESQLKAAGIKALRSEGADEGEWVLIDYGDFVVHAFLDEARHFYDLERLWSDAPLVEWESTPASS